VGSFGVQEMLVILLIVFILFGANKVPEIMRSLGQGIRTFKEESNRIMRDIESAGEDERD
jgi:sec-independent protein translocase protein TatA